MFKAGSSFARLSWRDRRDIVAIVLTAGAIEVGLRLLRLPKLASLAGVPLDLDTRSPAAPMLEPLPDWALRQLEFTHAVMRHWPRGNTCLRRSLVAGRRLRRLHPSLRVGVARDGRVLLAHAWLEIDGQYFDSGASTYATVLGVTS